MRDYFSIGPTPSEEDCAQVQQPDYRRKAWKSASDSSSLFVPHLALNPKARNLRSRAFPMISARTMKS